MDDACDWPLWLPLLVEAPGADDARLSNRSCGVDWKAYGEMGVAVPR